MLQEKRSTAHSATETIITPRNVGANTDRTKSPQLTPMKLLNKIVTREEETLNIEVVVVVDVDLDAVEEDHKINRKVPQVVA